MAKETAKTEKIPKTICKLMEEFGGSTDEVFRLISNFITIPRETRIRQMSSLEKAQYELEIMYLINALYWTQLQLHGTNAQYQKVKEEMERIKKYMIRCSIIRDTRKRKLQLDMPVVKRLIDRGLNKK
ncbi:hypothetical protein SNEBB_005705 [Seison nebaliae]|nr:hypothetical protein SNEBB_005705 [Seison nebaliae]